MHDFQPRHDLELDQLEPDDDAQWHGGTPGKTSTAARDYGAVAAVANAGVATANQKLPHYDVVQRAFGRFDVGNVRAAVGGDASRACDAIDAEAYAVGDRVAFRDTPDLHTAAHEAAHVLQQRTGISAASDVYEQHADAVADRVVRGCSAEPLLAMMIGDDLAARAASAHVQRKPAAPRYSAADRRAAAHGLQVLRLGAVSKGIGQSYIIWNFPPGSADVGAGHPALAQIRATLTALFQPITGPLDYRNRMGGKARLPRINPFAAKQPPHVRIEGITDRVGGYKTKTDRGLRIRRAQAVWRLLVANMPKHKRPRHTIAAASRDKYLVDLKGPRARAANRAVIVHITPSVKKLTDQQTREVLARDREKQAQKEWPVAARALTRQRLLKGLIPSSVAMLKVPAHRDIAVFVVNNYPFLIARRHGASGLTALHNPKQRPNNPAELTDWSKVDDLRMLAACVNEIRQFDHEYHKHTQPLYFHKPATRTEWIGAMKYNRVKRKLLVRQWKFFKGTRGSFAIKRRRSLRAEFRKLVKWFRWASRNASLGKAAGPLSLP